MVGGKTSDAERAKHVLHPQAPSELGGAHIARSTYRAADNTLNPKLPVCGQQTGSGLADLQAPKGSFQTDLFWNAETSRELQHPAPEATI